MRFSHGFMAFSYVPVSGEFTPLEYRANMSNYNVKVDTLNKEKYKNYNFL